MGMTCRIIFDGISSDDIGVTVESYPGTTIPEKDIETQNIPGRNGELVYDYGTYKNYIQNYTIHWRNVLRDARITEWLCKNGYKRLEDSFHPGHYRMACFSGSVQVNSAMEVLKRAQGIQFNCKPQWFRKEGDLPISVKSGNIIMNTGMEALPLITIKGSGNANVVLNDVSMQVSIPPNGIIVDCDLMDAYSPDRLQNLNKNLQLTNGKFPTLKNGKNKITFTGGATSVIIAPRWWDLL